MTHTAFDAVWHKKQEYIWSRGGDLNCFQDSLVLSVWVGSGPPRDPWPTCHLMPLDTRNKNAYGFGVRISTVFKIIGHILLLVGSGPLLELMAYISSNAPWHREQEYIRYRGQDPNSFCDIWSFPTPLGNDHRDHIKYTSHFVCNSQDMNLKTLCFYLWLFVQIITACIYNSLWFFLIGLYDRPHSPLT